MLEKRASAASIVLNHNMLWIVGGHNGDAPLQSSEFIQLGQPTVKGPDMPFTMVQSSMVQYDEKSIYIIGGHQNSSVSKKTWIVDPTNDFKIEEGPSLNFERRIHGCAKMTINGTTVLVVAGGHGRDGPLDSVEILNPSNDNKWTLGQ